MLKKNQLCKITLAIGLALGTSVFSVQAEENNSTDTQADQNVEKISILGSRVSSRTATDSAVPVDIITAESLTKGGFTELGQSLQATAPSFNFSRTQVSDGADLFRPATLRGLQPDQTLVLVNGKRRHTQAIFGISSTVGGGAAGTDMNSIPLTALKDVQVLRDGAAAQYGSDAIAGVINLSLKNTTDKVTGYLQAGSTGEGDGDFVSFGLNGGIDLGDEGGFLNLTLELRDADGTNRAQRDTGGSSALDDGSLSEDIRWSQGNAESEFTTLFYNMMIPVGEAELYSFGGISNRTALGNGFYRDYDSASRNVQQVYADGFLPRIDNEAQDISTSLGIRGDFNDNWSYDVSAVYGENVYDFDSVNTINASYAAEYVSNNPTATDSEIAANAGPTGGYSGGFRFDQLTFNADISGALEVGLPDTLYVAFGAEYRKENYEIVAGELASYACGASDSSSSFPSVIDSSVFAECGFQAYNGLQPEAAGTTSRDSYALYLDLENQITEDWLVGVAFRYEDYSDAGNDFVGKLSSRFNVTDNFSIRGAISSGFRAPSLQQSGYTAFTTNVGAGGVLVESFTAPVGSEFPTSLGVDGLTLETSDNLSLGFVFDATEEITITLDAYHIEVKDRITLGNGLEASDVAFSPEASAAHAATGATSVNYFSNAVDMTTKGVDLIITYNTEIAEGDFGITFAANFNDTEIDKINTPDDIPESVALSPLSESMLLNGQPHERGTLTFNYSKDKWKATVKANYFSETEVGFFGNDHIGLPGFLSPTGEFQDTSVVESAVLVDLNFDYQLSSTFSLSVGINNIFDVRPDELTADESLEFISNSAFQYPLRAVPYGFDGMSYYARVGFSF